MQRGYIKVWRKIEDSGLLQLHGTLALFLYMVMQASYKPKRIGMVDIERGQLISGRFKLSAAVGLSERSVRTCLEHLHKMDMITSKPTNHFTIYTIVNYNNYQDIDTVIDQPTDQQPTSNRPATDQQPTTTKEGKKESIEEVKPISSPKGSRYPEDSILTAKWGNTALEIRSDWTNEDVRIEHESFKDYWTAKPGKDGVKLDWLKTWRNWCRSSKRKGGINAV